MPISWQPPEALLLHTIDASAVELELVDAGPFATLTPPYDIALGMEAMTVTAIVDTVLTVDREQRGTTAPSFHFAGATVSGFPTEIIVDGVDYSLMVRDSLRRHEASPQGEVDAVFELDTMTPEDWLPDPDVAVLIREPGGDPYCSGLTARPVWVRRDDGMAHITITARGYAVTAAWDGYEDSRTWDAYTTANAIIQDTLAEKCPYISSDDSFIIDGVQSIADITEVILQSPRQIWDNLLAKGDLGDPVDWYVRTDTDGQPKLHVLVRPRQPTVKVPLSSIPQSALAWDTERQKTKVVLKWAQGYVVKEAPGASVTRWKPLDLSTRVDTLDVANWLAEEYLNLSSLLEAMAEGPITIEPGKPIYDESDVELDPRRLRAGWMVEFVDDDLNPITSPNDNLPIVPLQITDLEIDHRHQTASFSLGSGTEDDLDLAAQYVNFLAQKLVSPVSNLVPQTVAPPTNVPQGVRSQAVGYGGDGHVGWDTVAEDADIVTIFYGIDGGGVVIEPGRKNVIPVDQAGWVIGLRLETDDGTGDISTAPGPASISVTVTHQTPGDVPAAGTTIATIAVTADYAATPIDLPAEQSETPHAEEVAPGDKLIVFVDADPAPDAAKLATLGVTYRRTAGSSRGTADADPTIESVDANRDGSNVTTFTITTSQPCTVQIEFGPDTNYRSMYPRSAKLATISVLRVPGLPPDTHYRVHVFNANNSETVGTDGTV